MILTDSDINALLINIGKMHNLEEESSVMVTENGWTLTVRYDGMITADLRDYFGNVEHIPADFMKMIEDAVMSKLGL
jgi:hypothetical protein